MDRETQLLIGALMVFLLGGIATAAIVTQNITYQGVLTDSSGNPLNGNYQMTFRLYDTVSGGSPLGTSGPVSVTVTNGLFTSPVTFDSQYYDGRALWIGIAVGSDPEMTPRQELRPVPYAMSLRPGALINGTGLNYILKVDNSGGTGSGVWANTSSGVAIRGESAQSAGIYGKGKLGGFFTTNQGGTSSAWAGLAPGVDIQTTFPFNPALRVMTRGNDSYGVYSQTTGLRSVGIMGESDQDVGVYGKGTTGGYFTTNREGIGVHSVTSYDYSPGIQSSTHGRSSIGIAIETTGLSSRGLDVRTYNAGGLGIYSETKGEGSAGLLVRTLNKTSRGIYSETNGESSTGIYSETNGESSPGLDVRTYNKTSTGIFSETNGESSTGLDVRTFNRTSKGIYSETNGEGSPGLDIRTAGVGSPAIKIDTSGPSSFGLNVQTHNSYSPGIYSRTEGESSWGLTVSTFNKDSNGIISETHGENSTGLYVGTFKKGSNAIDAWSNQSAGIHAGGIIGGIFRSHTGGADWNNLNPGVKVETTHMYNPGIQVDTSGSYSQGIRVSTSGLDSAGIRVGTTGENSYGAYVLSDKASAIYADTQRTDQKYGIYTPDYIYAKGTQYPAVDVAEYFPVQGSPEPGTVMIIGPEGLIETSTVAYDTRVMGIVSTDPAVSLGARDTGNPGEVPIAVAGRVPCKVDAQYGAIHPGDLLTTSPTPGHAMKAINPKIGTLLGKALGSLESGTGTIEVLVTLQ